ncbi:MAG: alkaline phosphatase family protein [Elusimicrobia bacterium]|nr:alkaline phosphatase family protein [Elusimicrobiota bacterium]
MKRSLITALLGALAAAGCGREAGPRPTRDTGIRSVVLVGWDGCRQSDLERLLKAGKLPNLQGLITAGGYVRTRVTTGDTSTKPGWAEILTGYRAERLKITSNRNYQPIPRGYTLFERLKSVSAGKMAAAFLTGKINNLGHRGPHRICINCISRDTFTGSKTAYWDENEPSIKRVPTNDGGPQRWVSRKGEPYFNTVPSLDIHKAALGSAAHVGSEALAVLDRLRDRPFIAFFHFEEPDEEGHVYGEGAAEYRQAILAGDAWLGRIVMKLRQLGLFDATAVFVVTDHGMDAGQKEHFNAPETFLATNLRRRLRPGDRKDVAPTVLDALGLDASSIRPRLDGRSLFVE